MANYYIIANLDLKIIFFSLSLKLQRLTKIEISKCYGIFFASTGILLANNKRYIFRIINPEPTTIQITIEVIPLSLAVSCAYHVTTVLSTFMVVWFPARPCRIATVQWSAVNPVELTVSFSVKAKPDAPSSDILSFLLPEKVKYKLIFVC